MEISYTTKEKNIHFHRSPYNALRAVNKINSSNNHTNHLSNVSRQLLGGHDLDVATTRPNLVAFFAIPAPPQHVVAGWKIRGDAHFVHNLSVVGTPHVRARELLRVFAEGLESLSSLHVVGPACPRSVLVAPGSGHWVHGPHAAGRGGALFHSGAVEVVRAPARAAPTEPRLIAHKVQRVLLETGFVELLLQRTEAVGIAPTVVSLERPRDLNGGASDPLYSRWRVRELRAPVAQFRVSSVLVLCTKAAFTLTWDAAARNATGVDHRSAAWSSPRRVVEKVIRRAALGTGVHGALFGVAYRSVQWLGTDGGLGAECWFKTRDRLNFARLGWLTRNTLEFRDGAASAAIALVTTDSAAVGKPEACLAVGTREVATGITDSSNLRRERAPRFEGHWCGDLAAPRHFIAVNRIARRRVCHSAVAVRPRQPHSKKHHWQADGAHFFPQTTNNNNN